MPLQSRPIRCPEAILHKRSRTARQKKQLDGDETGEGKNLTPAKLKM
jgi:hypothetical protein